MPRARNLLAAVAVMATTLTVSACGSDSDPEPSAQRPATTTQAAAGDAGITQGRIGDATAADSRTGTHLLARGRAVKPGDKRPGQPDREGVGAAVDCPGIDDQTTAATAAASNAAIFCLLNSVRGAAGVPALTENAVLEAAATAYAKAMVADRFFSHTGADGSSLSDRIRKTGYLTGAWTIGENLALGGGALSTPRAIVEAWLNSEGHRRNIIDPDFREIGLGVAIGIATTGDDDGATFVNEFGANGSSDADAAADSTVAAAPSSTSATAAPRTVRKRRVPCAQRRTAKARKACRVLAARRAAAARRARAAAANR